MDRGLEEGARPVESLSKVSICAMTCDEGFSFFVIFVALLHHPLSVSYVWHEENIQPHTNTHKYELITNVVC